MAKRAPAPADWEEAQKHVGLIKVLIEELIAKSPFPNPLSREDLLQAGLIATAHAHAYFKPEQGCQFSTYAAASIRNALWEEAHREQDGKHRTYIVRNIGSIEAMNLVGAEEGAGEHLATGLVDHATPSAEDEYLERVEDPRIAQMMATLDQLEQDAHPTRRKPYQRLRKNFFEGKTQRQIATEEGVTQQTIDQSIGYAMAKLRAALTTVSDEDAA